MAKPNVIRLTTPFERIKLYNVSPDVALRRAIITQAIIDATNISPKMEAKKMEYEAKGWIFGRSEDFLSICFEAEIEPSVVVRITKELIKLHKNKSQFRENNIIPLKSKSLKKTRNRIEAS
ncbi:hypothetical protein [Rickettsia endosymbiont of Halotydeus destructor]|uniref:hypothetical protein n=1 Tax=Rickettsia endosymbiont of Halotydeus destructor TaxID=2996754 RepID=UPI003BB0CC24